LVGRCRAGTPTASARRRSVIDGATGTDGRAPAPKSGAASVPPSRLPRSPRRAARHSATARSIAHSAVSIRAGSAVARAAPSRSCAARSPAAREGLPSVAEVELVAARPPA
jgi:hypothetical protein